MKKKPQQLAQLNMLERAIQTLAPQWAFKRHRARSMMAVTGGYSGASYNHRTSNWMTGTGDADSETVMDLPDLRGRSRDLYRNSPIAAGACETEVSHVIGTGLMLQPQVDAETLGLDEDQAEEFHAMVKRHWLPWAESVFCDASESQNFYELQDLAYRTEWLSGDCVGLLVDVDRQGPSAGLPSLAIQLLESDRVCNPQLAMDTPEMVQGFEKNSRGAAVAVHVADRHPGGGLSAKNINWTRVEIWGKDSGRRNVLHLMRKRRVGQTRGVPQLAPIIEHLKQLERYSMAEVDAAVNSATIAMFAKMDAEAFEDIFDDDAKASIIQNAMRWDGQVRSGSVVNLLPGESIESPASGRPNPNFDPFFTAMLKQVGIGLNIPFEVLTKHFQSSYSAARAALLDAWRFFKIRRAAVATRFCQPVYEEWLAAMVADGVISAPGFFSSPMIRRAWCSAVWMGDGPGAIDPLKEVSAAEKRVNMGLTTLEEEVAAYDGGDWATKHRQRTVEHDERVEAGLEPEILAPAGHTGQVAQNASGQAAPAEGTPDSQKRGTDDSESPEDASGGGPTDD